MEEITKADQPDWVEMCSSWDWALVDATTVSSTACEESSRSTVEYTYDSSAVLAYLLAYNACLVLIFSSGKDLQSSIRSVCSLRLASCAILTFMSLLVFVGAVHLLRVSRDEEFVPGEDPSFRQEWSCVYMAVSLLCFSRAAHIALPHSTKSDEIKAASAGPEFCYGFFRNWQAQRCYKRPTCYRILSIFLPVIRGMHFLLTQVWDANGRYFWVKLLIIEVVEIIVQFTSLASSAVDSDG